MLRVSCRDIGVEGCDFSCAAEKAGKVEDLLLAHLRDAHPEIITGLDCKQYAELERRVKSATSGFGPSSAAGTPTGSSAIPQMGQLPAGTTRSHWLQ